MIDRIETSNAYQSGKIETHYPEYYLIDKVSFSE